MKNNKKLFILLVGIFICLLLFSIVLIYAKYLSSASGQTDVNIARWNIIVNDKSIKNNTDISSAIQPVFEGNENIASNIIAPTAEGYFDLNFDFTDVDVSFKYEITVSSNENSSVSDLVTTGYSQDDGEKITFDEFNKPITDTISLGDNIDNRKIRVYIIWNDDETSSTMTDEDDTQSTKQDLPALLNVNISFTQVAD